MKTYSVLSYNRTGSTVVGQCLAAYYGLDYQAEITNIPSVLMRYDETGKDVNVPYKIPLPQGTYTKTYTITNKRVERIFNYDNPKPFIPESEAFDLEVEKRSGLIRYNSNSEYKSIFKIQPQTFCNNFKDQSILDDYTFIFCARKDIYEQILSYLVAMNTRLFHVGYDDQIVDAKPITITRKQFKFCLDGLRQTNQMFELHRDKIETVIYYEDWQDDTNKILPLLGFKYKPVNTFKKIKYSVGSKHNLVNNLQEVYDWMENEPEFNYAYKL